MTNKKRSKVGSVSIFAVSVVLIFLSLSTDAKAFFGRSAAVSTIGELTTQLQTPDSIAKYMWRNFMYVDDEQLFGTVEHWQTPQEFLSNKKGDCEDFALFAKSLLEANGTKAFLLNVYGKNYGHTVCVFEENGKFNVIDKSQIHRYQATSIEELSSMIYPKWDKSMIVKKADGQARGQILQSFEKRMKAHKSLSIFA